MTFPWCDLFENRFVILLPPSGTLAFRRSADEYRYRRVNLVWGMRKKC